MIADCLCNLQFLDRSCKLGFISDLFSYFVECCSKIDLNEAKLLNLSEMEQLIRKNLRFLTKYPTLFLQCAANDRGSIAINEKSKEWLLNNRNCSGNIAELISEHSVTGATLIQCIEAPTLQVNSFSNKMKILHLVSLSSLLIIIFHCLENHFSLHLQWKSCNYYKHLCLPLRSRNDESMQQNENMQQFFCDYSIFI